MPVETFEEVKDGGTDAERDMLYAWVQEDAHKSAILFDEDVRPELVQQVVGHYAADLTDDELEAIGRDPFLIARALRSEEHTSELQSLMRISYAVFCLTKKKKTTTK